MHIEESYQDGIQWTLFEFDDTDATDVKMKL
jgi:hypothetical protein